LGQNTNLRPNLTSDNVRGQIRS